jgi:hypothetical protein
MAKIAGKNGRFKVASNNVAVRNFTGTLHNDLLDATTTEGSGWAEFVPGVAEGSFSCDIVYDPTVTPVAIMTPGGSYTVELFPVLASSSAKISGTGLIEDHEITGEARGLVTARVSGKYTGVITYASM